ncbi:MAG: recombinase family protein [Aminipila sp.]
MGELLCGCYVRVSTENQIENYSIDEQIERLKSYCFAKEIKIKDFYIDAGYSGGNINRPALEKMLKDIKSKSINSVVVYKLDRLSRSQKDTLTLIEDNFKDIAFISVQENFDTSTPLGKAMIGILSVFAQLEKDQITERFTMGRIGRSKAGYFHGGSVPPFGYNYVNGELVVNEEESEQVKEVFSMFLDGFSINRILNDMKSKYGGWSGASRIAYTLKNPVYIGNVRFKGMTYKGVHQPIISNEDFNNVQKLLSSEDREESKTAAQKSPFRASYLLTGLIFCGECGARYSGGHGYYKCYSVSKNSKRFVKKENCQSPKFKIDELDEYVLNEIIELKSNPQRLNEIVSRVPKAKANNEDKIKGIEKQINKLIDLYQFNKIPIDEVNKRINQLQEQKEKLSVVEVPKDNSKEFKKAINSLDKIMKNGELESKRLVFSTLIKRITINANEIDIEWRI